MLQPISLFASFTPPTLLAFLSYVSFSPSVHAQLFQPLPSINPCNAFVGGQGLYIIGGVTKDLTTVRQTFMLDLSVSWSIDAPVFKQLPFGPKGGGVCTMINSGEDLFVLEDGGGYLYNVRSEKWQVLSDTNFTDIVVGVAATDPESGLIYIVGSSADLAEQLIETIDPRTMTANTAKTNAESYSVAAWSTPLKRMLLFSTGSSNPGTFTPSETNNPTKGWGDLPNNGPTLRWSCIAPIDGGSKMALYGNDVVSNIGTIYVFDVAERTWTKGASTIELDGCVCAVTGDQVVLWGGESKGKATNATLVYNMKTNTWTSNYIAPPRSDTTTTRATSQPSQTPTQENPDTTNTPGPGDSSSDGPGLALLPVPLGIMFALLYAAYRIEKQMKQYSDQAKADAQSSDSDDSSSDSQDTQGYSDTAKTLLKGTQRRDPTDSTRSSTTLTSNEPDRLQPPPEHPHAITEDAIQLCSVQYNDEPERDRLRWHGGKEELMK